MTEHIVAVSTATNLALWLGAVGGLIVLLLLFCSKLPAVVLGALGVEVPSQSILGWVQQALDARAARIDAQLRMAEESRAQAARAHAESQREISDAREEARNIVERAETMSAALREELTITAEEDGRRIVAQARDEIEAERNRAVMQLRTQAADAAIDAAREVVRQTLDAAADRSIIERALGREMPGSGGIDRGSVS